jgi:hypothetical protein
VLSTSHCRSWGTAASVFVSGCTEGILAFRRRHDWSRGSGLFSAALGFEIFQSSLSEPLLDATDDRVEDYLVTAEFKTS